MTHDELEGLERALGITLPAAYLRAVMAGRLRAFQNADPGSVAAITQAFRAGDFGDPAWPPGLFAFADNGMGDHYCLDASRQDTRVFRRDHETLEIVEEHPDFEAWLASR